MAERRKRWWSRLVANRLIIMAVAIWFITFGISLLAAWVLVIYFGELEATVSTQGALGPVTFSIERQPQARTVILGLIGTLGFAALIAMPTRLLWDEVSKVQEDRRTFARARRERMLHQKSEYYVPLFDRLEYLLGASGQCQRALEKQSADVPYARLLHALVLLQSTVVWAHSNGISFLFRTEAHRKRVSDRWQAHQQELLLNFFEDPVADLLLAESARNPDVAIPLDHEITSRLLVRIEYEYSELESLVMTPDTEGSIARRLYDTVEGLTLVECRRLRLLTGAWWSDLDRALRHLESDNTRDDVDFQELRPSLDVALYWDSETHLVVFVCAARGVDTPAAKIQIEAGNATMTDEVDEVGLLVTSVEIAEDVKTIVVTAGSSRTETPVPPGRPGSL